MLRMKFLPVRWLALVLAGIACHALPVAAQSVQHLSAPQPGGMPGLPVMGGINQLTNGVLITWDGLSAIIRSSKKATA